MSPKNPTLPPAPASLRGPDGFAFGRYRGPIASPAIDAPFARRFRLKEWHYLSIVTEARFVALGLVQLGYAAQLFAYAVDRGAPARAVEVERMAPLGRGLSMAESTVRGETRFARGRDRVLVRPRDGFDVEVDIALGGERLVGSFHVDAAPGLSLVFPLEADRPAYTHKAAGMRAFGTLSLGGRPILAPGVDGLAVSDFTRSLARRHTRWKWASFAHRVDGRAVGLNLSAEVYDDAAGRSEENALFLGAEDTVPLGGVRFALPNEPRREPWRIASVEGDEVDLRFEPLGARAQDLALGVVRTRFVQPYGLFHGRVRDVRIDGAFGVVEDHDSLW